MPNARELKYTRIDKTERSKSDRRRPTDAACLAPMALPFPRRNPTLIPEAPDKAPTNIHVIHKMRYDALNKPTSLSPIDAAMAPMTPILQKSEDSDKAAGK